MNVSIRRIGESDWREFRAIRLKALKSDPEVFGSSYEKESANSDDDWIAWVNRENGRIFHIYDGSKLIGMTGIYFGDGKDDDETAFLWGSWLEPDYRRRGISDLMYKVRIECAKENENIRGIVVSHRESNVASKFANQKHGFELTSKKEKTWSDGETEDEIFYEFEVVDPESYEKPFRGEMSFRPITDKVYEYACHEANYAMPTMLKGARLEESESGSD